MGFRAVDAEDVYRYALRLDRGRERSLTDGFGFSIVFVNDRSPQCQEFLAEHFVDLCHRTADRIRFVFFADLDKRAFDRVADEMNHGHRRHQGGFLGWLVGIFRRGAQTPGSEVIQLLSRCGVPRWDLDALGERLRRWASPPPTNRTERADAYELVETFELLNHWARSAFGGLPRAELEPVRELVEWLLRLPVRGYEGELAKDIADRILWELDAAARRDSWRGLAPRALRAVESPEQELPHLGWEKETYSAVPGAGEAMRFAQRLGIGRHVPCVVVFTDVGELRVDVMPVGGMAAKDIYSRVRGWVDRFYERNSAAIENWHKVEKEIDDLRWRADASLREVRGYADRAAGTWRELRAVAELMRGVGGLDSADTHWRTTLPEPHRCSNFVSDALKTFRQAWSALAERKGTARHLVIARETIESADGFDAIFDAIFDALGNIHRKSPPPPDSDCGKVLTAAMAAMLKYRHDGQAADVARQLDSWWHGFAGRAPSQKQFKKAWKGWSSLPQKDVDLGKEHARLIDALTRVSLATDPERGATEALTALAAEHGLDGLGASWLAETAGYREHLRGYLAQIQESAPAWLREACPSATLAEALPPRSPDDKRAVDEVYPDGTAIGLALRNRAAQGAAEVQRIRAEGARVASEWKAVVRAAFRAAEVASRLRQEEWELPRARLLADLRARRNELTAQLASCQRPGGNRPGEPLDPVDLRRLEASLDAYQEVVRSLDFSHRHDPNILSVALTGTPLADLTRTATGPAPAERYRAALSSAKRTDGEATTAWEQVAAAVSRWTPAAVLAEAIISSVSGDRLEGLVMGSGVGALSLRVREALLADRARELLGELTDLELGAVLSAIPGEGTVWPEAPAATRAGRIAQILTRSGADDRPPLFGQQAFTLFLDRIASEVEELSPAAVGHVGTDTRRGLEQYLKQFLALYSPLGLTPDERQEVTNATLGTLTGYVIRVLSRPDPNSDACRADQRWHELASRVHRATARPGWLDRLTESLQTLPVLANCFPHHIVRGDREMTDGERRQTLRSLISEATRVVRELGDSDLYPICLRFVNLTPDHLYVVRYEFQSDPARGEREIVAFSTFPPSMPGFAGNFLEALYRQILMMVPFTDSQRVDPLIAPLVPT